MRPNYGPWRGMNMQNGMRPPMRGRGGGPGGPMRGMGPRPPYPGMGPPMRHFGPPPMGPGPRGGPHNRGAGPMMPRMRPPPPHMMPQMMRAPRPMRQPIKKIHNKMPQNEGKIKKKKLKFRSFYATRPWVNDELRAEISKKDKLFDQAKSSNKADDWATFKEQKDKCVHMYSALKLEFIGQHPEEVFSPDEEECAEDEADYLCEPCDRTFDDDDSFRKHLGEHQTCGIDGCKFNAHELLVLAHIKMQHSSGLYDKIRNISTPEDIVKWREQRKRNYPSKANIELRYKQQAEMLKRGERIGPNKDRFGRTKNLQAEKREKQKLAKKRKKKQPKHNLKTEPVSLIDEKADWNGTMFPFRGTNTLHDEDEDEVISEELKEFSDDEWDHHTEGGNVQEHVLNNALGALMGAYQSDSDDDAMPRKKQKSNKQLVSSVPTAENIPSTSNRNQQKPNLEIFNADDIIETKILKVPVDLPDKATEMKAIERKRIVPVTATPDDMPIPPKTVKSRNQKLPPPQIKHFRKPTLLQKLLDKEIRHERNVILQCVRFVVNNNFFDTVKDNLINDGASTSKG